MPMAIARNMNPISRVSLTALRKRMTDSAPTREKARAMFEPMMSMMSPVTMLMMTRVCANDWAYDVPRWVAR